MTWTALALAAMAPVMFKESIRVFLGTSLALTIASCTSISKGDEAANVDRLAGRTGDIAAWETLGTEAYKGKRDSISFAGPAHGWYGTGAGDLFRTQDAGASWQKVASRPGTFVRAVAFLDRDNGFIGNIGTGYYPGVSDPTPLYRTRDGGATWTPVDTGIATIVGVCAIDVLKVRRINQGVLEDRWMIHAAGRVGGPSGMLRSLDGGESWEVIDMSDKIGMITDVRFFDERNGLVFGASDADVAEAEGVVLATADGGQSWREVYRSGRKAEVVWKADFPSRDTGFGTVQSYDPERVTQVIIKTLDGGGNWAEMPITDNAKARQFGIGFLNERVGFVGTVVGGFATEDGGKTWRGVPIAPAANKFTVVDDGSSGGAIYAIGTQVQRLQY